MQVIGLCRFSYPAIGGFQVGHDTVADRQAYLWAPDRLEERFRLFETMALPCLRAQTDGDFDLILQIGEDFPKQHRDRLHDLTADIPQIEIIAMPPMPSRKASKMLLNAARRDPDAPCIQCRHDDDDACAGEFIARMRQAVTDTAPLVAKHAAIGFDWNKGYVAELGPSGISATKTYRAFYVSALGVHIAGGSDTTIHNFMHARIPRFMPCVTFPDADMFVRSHNGYNDSRQKQVRPVAVAPLTPDQEQIFRTRFAIDADAVRRTFSGA